MFDLQNQTLFVAALTPIIAIINDKKKSGKYVKVQSIDKTLTVM